MDEERAEDADSLPSPPSAVAEEERWVLVPAADVRGADSPKVLHWEKLQQELGRLCSLASALEQAKELKDPLAHRMESFLEVRKSFLQQKNELDEMRKNLTMRRGRVGDLVACSKKLADDVQVQRAELRHKIEVLLLASKTLSAAKNKLQGAKDLLLTENQTALRNMLKALKTRQQFMVSQVSRLYPVMDTSNNYRNLVGVKSGDDGLVLANSPRNPRLPPTILGLQLTKLPIKMTGYFNDKKVFQESSTVLGYVAHAVLLISSYLNVPLRYRVKLGGSRSYIIDHAPSIEFTPSDNLLVESVSQTDFPLFFEGQDATIATYAIFLLNKDLEQLLNYIGKAENIQSRHVLVYLKELMQQIQSEEYLVSS